ncbi:DUF4147 domain-containing protein [Jhaorihella thermophila]
MAAMNAERRRLSRIKGGGLLSHFRGATALVLAISDVPGDDLAVIGSGIGLVPEGADFDHAARIVASNAIARAAVARAARARGLEVLANEEALHDELGALAARWGAAAARDGKGRDRAGRRADGGVAGASRPRRAQSGACAGARAGDCRNRGSGGRGGRH